MKQSEKISVRACLRSILVPWVLVQFILMPGLAADEYTVDWHLIGHGGGTSANQEFSVSGVIGQPMASKEAIADEFTVTGGFSVVTALQTEGAPPLAVALIREGAVKVFWPIPDVGWELRHSVALTAVTWERPVEPIQDDGTFRFISVIPSAGPRFYRLFAVNPAFSNQDGHKIPIGPKVKLGIDQKIGDTDQDGVPDHRKDSGVDRLPRARD